MPLSVVFENPKEIPREGLHLPIEVQKAEGKPKLKGTHSEALDAVEATISRLNKLGATIRRYSTSSLESRVKASTEKHGDENYTALAKLIVQFKYRAATASLQEQLGVSMSSRRQRLRYIGRHQAKLASRQQKVENEQPVGRPDRLKSFSPALEAIDEAPRDNAPIAGPSRKKMVIRQSHNSLSMESFAPSETKASSFKPTHSVIARLKKGDGASVVSSSKDSKTPMVEDLESYPEAPKKQPGKPDPTCTFCCRPLQDWELKIGKWQYDLGWK
jgi:hypothetical protein